MPPTPTSGFFLVAERPTGKEWSVSQHPSYTDASRYAHNVAAFSATHGPFPVPRNIPITPDLLNLIALILNTVT